MWGTVPEKVTGDFGELPFAKEIQTKAQLMPYSPRLKKRRDKANLVKRLPTIEHAKREFKITRREW